MTLHQLGLTCGRVVRHCEVDIQQADLEQKLARLPRLLLTKRRLTNSGWAWMTCAMLSRVKVSSRKRRLMSFKTSA